MPSPAPAGGRLLAVAATSAANARAAGTTSAGKTLILSLNGTRWRQVSSPSPATPAFLSGVAALWARSVWAVGYYAKGSTLGQTLILRWNGTSWRRVPSPTPAGGAFLLGVAAVSARTAWAVGGGLILRWNGTIWM